MRMSVKLLGGFQVWVNDQPITDFRSDRERALLAYLAMDSEQTHSRQTLMTLLWPDHDPERARNNLRVSIHRLRKTLNSPTDETEWLNVSSQQIGLTNRDAIEVDARVFADYLNQHTDLRDDVARFQQIVDLYRGDFLQGFDLGDSTLFADWVSLNRERLHRLALQALHSLADHHLRRGDLKPAVQAARRQIELEGWREEAHIQLMKGLALGGERSAALSQYKALETALESELGITPSPDSTHLRDSIQTLHDSPDPVSIPGAATQFVGRSGELHTLREMLALPEVRLISLVGPGGIGKSRLALELAEQARTAHLHGVQWINLLLVHDAALVPFIIADALGVFTPNNGTPQDQLIDYLRSKELLLVLDNFEHVIDAAVFLSTLIEQTEFLKVMITSRERLMLPVEHTFSVGGMSSDATQAAGDDAIRLFDAAARRVNPAFVIEENAASVAALCQIVQGVPLAIELAAAWAGTLTPEHIVAEIERSPAFLATRSIGLHDRHSSLEAVFDQTWARLSPDEQQMLTTLTIFPESFDYDAATAVADIPLDVLDNLINKSLIQQRLADNASVYTFHPMIRRFATARLADGGQHDLRERHARYYLGLIASEYPHLRSPDAPAALKRVHHLYPNIPLALENGSHLLDEEAIRGLLDVLMFYHEIYGRYREAQEQFALLAQSLKAHPELPLAGTHAAAYYGWYLMRRGDYDAAYQLGVAAITEGRRQEDARNIIIGHDICAIIDQFHNKPDEAETHFRQALQVALTSDNTWWAASLNHNLSRMRLAHGDLEQAEDYAEAAMQAYRQLGDAWGIATTLILTGDIKLQLQQWAHADLLYREHMVAARAIDYRRGIAQGHIRLGDIARKRDDLTTAYEEYQQGLVLSRDIGERRAVALNLARLGITSLELGDIAQARSYLRQAFELALEIDAQDLLLEGALYLTLILRQLGDQQAAYQVFAAIPSAESLAADLQPLYADIAATFDQTLEGHRSSAALETLVLAHM